jgi:hypothetical protein
MLIKKGFILSEKHRMLKLHKAVKTGITTTTENGILILSNKAKKGIIMHYNFIYIKRKNIFKTKK